MLKAATHLKHSNQGKGILTHLPRFEQHEGFRFLTMHLVQHLNAAEWLLKLGPEHTFLHITVLFRRAVITYSTVNGLPQVWWVPCQASEEVFQIHHAPSPATPPLRYQRQIVACLHPSHTLSQITLSHKVNRAAALYFVVDFLCCLQAGKCQETEVD